MTAHPLPLILADDEEGIRTVLSLLLTDMGYAVRTAADGREALALFEEQRPAVVVTDIKMPGMDGLMLLEAVKRRDAGVEVIMLTGHGDLELAVTSLRLGAGDFLNKPVSDQALEVALARARERMAIREALRRHTEELEDLVRQRTVELVRSERLAAVGETAAGLAHDIKNMAGALEGTMYVLEKGLELNKREYFEQGWAMIRADVARLKDLAVNLLDLGRPGGLDFAPVSPWEPLDEAARLARARAEAEGVALAAAVEQADRPAGEWIMDREAVLRCLLNLVLNAVEACAAGAAGPGRVVLSVAVTDQPQGNAVLEYAVEDNGPGFSPDAAGNEDGLFVSSKEGGSGIGLFTVRKLAREMGAQLLFQPAPQGGTRAVLRLPTLDLNVETS